MAESAPSLFQPGGLVEQSVIEWMYTRPGSVTDKEEGVLWVMSRSGICFIAAQKVDVAALGRVVVWHDSAFTLARQYPMEAGHNIEHI